LCEADGEGFQPSQSILRSAGENSSRIVFLVRDFDLGQEFAAREFELSFIATRRMSTIPSNLVKSAKIASSTRRISAECVRIFGDEFLINTWQTVQLARSLVVHKAPHA
jgi:hypothetical protein